MVLSNIAKVLACFYLLYGFVAHAQNSIEQVDVYGKRIQQDFDVHDINLHNYSGYSKVISRQEFDTNTTNLVDILNQQARVQTRQRGGLGSASSVSIRGSNGKQINYYFDGMLLNSPLYGDSNVESIPAVLIERVEIYPDFTPAQLGQSNLAGAINFVSRQAQDHNSQGQIRLSQGSFHTQELQLTQWLSLSDWQFVAAASALEAENDFTIDNAQLQQRSLQNCDDSCRRNNDAYRNNNGFLSVKRDWNSLKLKLLLQHQATDKSLPTPQNRAQDSAFISNDLSRLQARISHDYKDWQFGHSYIGSRKNAWFLDNDSNFSLTNEGSIRTSINSHQLRSVFQHESAASAQTIGISLRDDDIKQDNRLSGTQVIEGQRQTISLSYARQLTIATDLMLVSNVAASHIEDSVDYYRFDKQPSDSINTASFHLGSNWLMTDSVTIKTNYAYNMRAPNLLEKFGNSGLSQGNLELKEESAHVIDFGFNYEKNSLSLNSSIYYKNISDGIFNQYDSRGVAKPENFGAAMIAGIEAEVSLQARPWMRLSSYANLMSSENQSRQIKAAYGLELPGIYHQNAGASISLQQAGIDWTTSFN